MDETELDHMWEFIESILVPYGLMPAKKDLRYYDVSSLYSELKETDEMFKTLEQIAILKKDVDTLKDRR